MNAPRVSMVASAASTETSDADAAEIVRRICSDEWREAIVRIRETFKDVLAKTGDLKAAKHAADPLKKKLAGVLWCGQFSSREKPAAEKLVQHSGLLCADLDNLGERLAEVCTKLKASPYLFALFESPTGNGLKAVFRVATDAGKHAASYHAVQAHVRELCGGEIDESRKDLAGLCFVSHDPDALLNINAVELPLLREAKTVKPALAVVPAAEFGSRRGVAEKILGEIEWQNETHGFCVCPGQHLHTTGNGERDCEIYLDGAPTLYCFHDHCRGVLSGVNHELRSQIAKAERAANTPMTRRHAIAAEYGLTTDCPTLDVMPYTPPPLRLLPPELQDYVLAASEALAVDVSYIFLPLLPALGTAIGNSRIVQLKRGFVQPPVVWTAIIGRSGSKKSPALDEATFPIREREREFIRQNVEAHQHHEKHLAEWEAAPRKERGLRPTAPPMLTGLMDDLTLASLAAALAENPRGLLVKKDELSHWFESFDQFTKAHGADVSRWLSLHTGALFAYDRKTERESHRLFNPRVCIAGGIQPKTLRRCLTEDFFDRGLPARFLFACPPGQQDRWTEKTVPPNIRAAALAIFSRLYALAQVEVNGEWQPQALTLDADAKDEFVGFYNSVGAGAADASEREEAAWHKLTGYGARLALLGELARSDRERIAGDTMSAATELARWCGAESQRIYAMLGEDPETAALRRLCEFISRRGGMVSVRDVVTYYRPLKNRSDLAEAQLNQLASGGQGEWVPVASTPKGGRPTRPFRLFASATPCLRLQNREKLSKNVGIADADNSESLQNAIPPEPENQPELVADADLI